MEVPAKYARSAGTNGNTQGDEKDTTPAMKLTIKVNSVMKIRSSKDNTAHQDREPINDFTEFYQIATPKSPLSNMNEFATMLLASQNASAYDKLLHP